MQLKKALVDVKPKGFEDCVKWARQLFQDYYFNTISQLLYNFPPDHVGYTGANVRRGVADKEGGG